MFLQNFEFAENTKRVEPNQTKWIVSSPLRSTFLFLSDSCCNTISIFNMNFKNVVKHSHNLWIVMTSTRTFDSIIFVHRLALAELMLSLSLNATMHDARWTMSVEVYAHCTLFCSCILFLFWNCHCFCAQVRTKNDKLCSFGYALGNAHSVYFICVYCCTLPSGWWIFCCIFHCFLW